MGPQNRDENGFVLETSESLESVEKAANGTTREMEMEKEKGLMETGEEANLLHRRVNNMEQRDFVHEVRGETCEEHYHLR